MQKNENENALEGGRGKNFMVIFIYFIAPFYWCLVVAVGIFAATSACEHTFSGKGEGVWRVIYKLSAGASENSHNNNKHNILSPLYWANVKRSMLKLYTSTALVNIHANTSITIIQYSVHIYKHDWQGTRRTFHSHWWHCCLVAR